MNKTIILTSTVNVNLNKECLIQVNKEERLQLYIKSVLQWLNDTNFNIVLVENSGYSFEELESEKKKYSERFEIISYKEDQLTQASYLKNDISKGNSELFSLYYAYHNSKIISNSIFVIKVTGRFFIPGLEEYLSNYDLNNYDCLTQNNRGRCEMVGSHIKNYNYIFSIIYMQNNPQFIGHVEDEYKYRTSQFESDRVLTCKDFEIEETQRGGVDMKYVNI